MRARLRRRWNIGDSKMLRQQTGRKPVTEARRKSPAALAP